MKRNVGFISIAIVMTLMLSACGLTGVATNALNQLVATAPTQAAPAQVLPVSIQPQAQTATPQAVASSSVISALDPAVSGLENAVQQIYDKVNPSVVLINTTQQVSARGGFGGFNQGTQVAQALGSGFVWDKNGYIVTNNHVVEGSDTIVVTFPDGQTATAKLVGRDVNSDLAVIKVDVAASHLIPVTLTDSTAVKVGQLVIAIGNPFGESGSLSVGFVSGLGRNLDVANNNSNSQFTSGSNYQIPDIIQTDAPINPGNSGGVLVDAQGQVIGVTAAIESSTNSNSGVGFAIPSVLVNRVVPSLIKSGSYQHPYLGISGTTLQPSLATAMNLSADQRGVLISDVSAGGPAEKAGLQGGNQQVTLNGNQVVVGGDVIVSVDGQPVETFDSLLTYLERTTSPGQKITLGILRGGKSMNVELTLGSRPSSASSIIPTNSSNQSSLTTAA